LRTNNYPDFKFLVEPRELTDEQAFRLADLENRARKDISEYERAKDYLRGLDLYYGGEQKAMAARFSVTESWLSRYLDLARLPAAIVCAFASPHDLRIKHITQIKPLLKDVTSREAVLDCATRIAGLRKKDDTYLREASSVVRELQGAVEVLKQRSKTRAVNLGKSLATIERPSDGEEVATIDKKTAKRLTVTFHLSGLRSRPQAEEAVRLLVEKCWPEST
jgi:ParB family transcriptional regulator, chromosome partitioning protein